MFEVEDRNAKFNCPPDYLSVDISYVLFGGFMIKDLKYNEKSL